MSDMTPDKAMEIIAKITGPQGLDCFSDEIEKAITGRRSQIDAINGEIHAYKTVLRIISSLKVQWGLIEDAKKEPVAEEPQAPSNKSVQLDTVLKRRLLDHKCTYRAFDTKKWCERPLKTKEEQSSGYCRIHMQELQLIPEDGNTETGLSDTDVSKKKSGRRSRKES